MFLLFRRRSFYTLSASGGWWIFSGTAQPTSHITDIIVDDG